MLLFSLLIFSLVAGAASAKGQGDFCRIEGQQREHEFDQKSFYKCTNNRWIIERCQFNYFYDREIGFCVRFTSPTISPPGLICHPGTRLPDLFDSTRYRECDRDGRGFTWRMCPSGSVFVPSESRCMNTQPTRPTYRPTTRTTTYPTTTTTPYYGACEESGGRKGYKPDINNCKNFYQCASGLWVQRSCAPGTIWNQQILTCDHNRGQCSYHSTHQPTYRPTWAPTSPTIGPTYGVPGGSFKK